jgi:hypothetical protein
MIGMAFASFIGVSLVVVAFFLSAFVLPRVLV